MNAEQAQKLARRFVELPADKRSLFLDALRREEVDFALFPIPSCEGLAEREGLSYAQQRMWFLWQFDASSPAYNLPVSVCLNGPFELQALERAFGLLVERHESLRTTFAQEGEQAVQRVAAPAPVTIGFRDLSALPETERWAVAREEMASQSLAPFDLEQGPLFRIRVLRTQAQQHVLLLTLHHIITDGWSMGVLIDECMRHYDALVTGTSAQLEPLPVQYRDYALWQRYWLEAGEQDRQLDYWRTHLGQEHPVLELPMDRPHPALPTQQGKCLEILLERDLLKGLQRLAQQQGVTLFVVLLASFKALLHRYSGQTDIRVGGLIANRTRSETEGLIGFFVNTQVLRTEVCADTRFDALLQAVRQTALGAQAHQELPFDAVVDGLQVPRLQNRNPLYQVMFNHRPLVTDAKDRQLACGLTVADLPAEQQAANERPQAAGSDLMLETSGEGEHLKASFTYATDVFDKSTVLRMAEHWRNLLSGICANPLARIDQLPLLGETEREFLVQGCNQSAHEYPLERSYVALFEEQVAAHPERIAVSCLERQGSYAELNAAANRLGHALIAAGAGFDQPIALLAERGPDLLGMIVGSFKAGAGYLPLDPALPNQRLTGVIAQSGAPVLVCSAACEAQAHELLAGLDSPVHLLVWEQVQQSGVSVDNPGRYSAPDNLAYVIFTSGSTGLPKGVMVEQRGMLNNQLSKVPYLDLSDADVIAQTASQSFDISVWQFLAAPLFGARVDIVPNDIARDPQALLAHVQAQGISVLESVPSLIQGLLAEERVSLDGLRWMLPTGEAMPPELAKQWLLRYPQIGLVNAYGPAECSDDVAFFRVDLDSTQSTYLPIGTPTDNNLIYLLDDALELVPLGAVGELCVAGTGVGRGYVADPRRTTPVFVPNPFGAPGERLYRTGDLARRRADGVLEYVGRADHQVKIRGYRIELGEIETRLQEHPAIREAVVLDIDGPQGKQLAAYVTTKVASDAEALREDLKTALKASLPDYMVPTHFVLLAAMPLTPNGKLDRKALPKPDTTLSQTAYVAPVTELEQQLAAIWAEVLKIERVGLSDNFFELGGHSLLAAQMIARIKKHLSVSLPLRTLFEKPLLSELAAEVAALTTTTTDDDWDDMDQFMDSLEEVGA
ncbi:MULTISPECIES: amino acid adenylation domain-containing protein [unclassified Pseudomonas]|uniref:amino acid adenylation domain-containing protein n=1 Tax=unclassified Pseudomonas TaxID=196821 RepID=UPI0021C90A5C|nr:MULTISPECIES: amino acid adenylation domain-containing protein [unclassified Pseudomonas]MCU1734444.1 amino acid adenylation domain-containing protein [Pseudomonas sp. 20P_3.2_Bac4]MCU1745817.1 amino acid adenylation domain-containing protein [Pseudomonas sp. 20P_3.2_Bac5]